MDLEKKDGMGEGFQGGGVRVGRKGEGIILDRF